MTKKELQDILEKHNKWLEGKEGGERANLIRANLRDADLTGVNLRDADLTGAHLVNVNLTGADLTGANLSGADLRGADLTMADLTGANLRGADLRGSNTYQTKIKSLINEFVHDIYYTHEICQIACWNITWEEWKEVAKYLTERLDKRVNMEENYKFSNEIDFMFESFEDFLEILEWLKAKIKRMEKDV